MFGGTYDRDRLIRHNLQRFLEPSAKPLSIRETLYGTAPLVPLAAALIGGIGVQYVLRPPLWTAMVLAGAAVVLVCLSFRFFSRRDYHVIVCTSAIVVLFVACGMLRYLAFASPGPTDIVRLVGDQRQLATLQGVIVSPIRHDEGTDWTFGAFFPRPPQSSFYLSVASVQTPDGPRSASGLIRVQVAERIGHVQRGDSVQLYVWLGPFGGADNPGQFDMGAYMRRRGVHLGASVAAAEGIMLLDSGRVRGLADLRELLIHYVAGALLQEADYPDASAALAAALLLGQRTELSAEMYAAFQRTGLAHFISLSGLHVGILAGSLWGLSRFFGLKKPMRAAVCMALLIGYGLVVPMRPPTMRALFLACFFLTSVIINRRIRPLNTLALSAMVLVLIRPAEVFSASWQLSFSTVLGILLLYDPMCRALQSWTVFQFVERLPARTLERPVVQYALAFISKIVQLLAVGLAAWLGGAGFLLYHFNSVTPLAALWTVLAMPLVLGILYAGYGTIALAPLFPTVSLLLAVGMDYCCRALVWMVSLFASVRWSEMLLGAAPISLIAGGYAVLLLIRFVPRCRAVKAALAVLLVAAAVGWTHHRNGPKTLTLSCLSVGHGLAVRVSFPDQTHWLIDAGSISHKDPGGRVVLAYLRHRGIGSLDAALLTHGDLDHYNGLPEVVSRTQTAGVFANAGVFEKAQSCPSMAYLKHVLRQSGNALRPIETLDALPQDAAVRMLWPDAEAAHNPALSDNDKSQVVWLEYGGRSVLICGDIELYAQGRILQRYPALKADVVILPHHGSRVTLTEEFVSAFEPAVVIASCAAGRVDNAFSPAADSGITAFYTPVDGAVTVTIKADGALRAVGFKSQKAVSLN